jgi:hypothetical protein
MIVTVIMLVVVIAHHMAVIMSMVMHLPGLAGR